jgi:hypothetical protein
VKPLYRDFANGERKQWILFGNSRKELETLHPRINNLLDEKEYPGDVILITGTMDKEEKFFYTNKFLQSPPSDDSTPTAESNDDRATRLYDPLGCLATRSLGGAGWDGPNVHSVISCDIPTSLLSAAQEKGRAGRRQGASFTTDRYFVMLSLRSFDYVLRRIHFPPGTDSDYKTSDAVLSLDEYRKQQERDLLEVLDVFVLPRECLHAALERHLANPYGPTPCSSVMIPPCGSGCDFCMGVYKKDHLPTVVHAGLKIVLHDLFLGPKAIKDTTLKDGFVTAIRDYPDAQKIIFASKARAKPERRFITRLILMLFSARILTHSITFDDDDKDKKKPIVCARLNSDDDRNLYLYDQSCWDLLPSKPAMN